MGSSRLIRVYPLAFPLILSQACDSSIPNECRLWFWLFQITRVSLWMCSTRHRSMVQGLGLWQPRGECIQSSGFLASARPSMGYDSIWDGKDNGRFSLALSFISCQTKYHLNLNTFFLFGLKIWTCFIFSPNLSVASINSRIETFLDIWQQSEFILLNKCVMHFLVCLKYV